MKWKKDPNVKYTELCIYIDAHVEDIRNPGENPEIEDTIYNYLWLLVKALAIKKGMFKNFQDYDAYAFYAASRLFFALRKNLVNRGKVIKGKLIRPIKSCLNYTKALLYPMKVEYQREAYREVVSEEFVSKKFDALMFGESLKVKANEMQLETIMGRHYLEETLASFNQILDDVLSKLPFRSNSVDYKRIRTSILINCVNNLKLNRRFNTEPANVVLWKLPKSMGTYLKVLLKEFFTTFAQELIDCYYENTIDTATLDKILNYKEGPDYSYDEQD